MTELEKDILTALNDLESTVRSMATANPKPALQPLLARVDDLAAEPLHAKPLRIGVAAVFGRT